MRISDWSSDVCSSDLAQCSRFMLRRRVSAGGKDKINRRNSGAYIDANEEDALSAMDAEGEILSHDAALHNLDARDRKSVVSGKSVSVRVDLGGRRIIKKKKV